MRFKDLVKRIKCRKSFKAPVDIWQVFIIKRQGSGIASSFEFFLNVHKEQNSFRRIFASDAIVDFLFHRTIFESISHFKQVS